MDEEIHRKWIFEPSVLVVDRVRPEFLLLMVDGHCFGAHVDRQTRSASACLDHLGQEAILRVPDLGWRGSDLHQL